MSLTKYKKKRNFKNTPEPKSTLLKNSKGLHFVIQKHNASHLHYDFRLEMEGVLKSWAIPKGPSLNPNDKRLAVMVEDHPFEYRNFKGIIPEGNYGAGTVEIWDEGTYSPLENKTIKSNEIELLAELKKGDLKFILQGKKLRGAFALVRMNNGGGKNWLLIKKKDSYSISKEYNIESIKALHQLNKKDKQSPVYKKKSKSNVKKLIKHNTPEKDKNDISFQAAIKELSLPMLAKYIDAPFDDPDWIYEYKWDGYRVIAAIQKGNVELFSRNKISLNSRFPLIAKTLEKIKDTVILDGEVVAKDEKGKHSFQLLQNSQSTGNGQLAYYIFDLLYLNGKKTTSLKLSDRKELLEKLYNNYKPTSVFLSEFIKKKGIDLFKQAKRKGMEGIMAKDSHSTYEPGHRASSWLKIKTFLQQEAIICGFTKPRGSRKKFGSLILGVYNNGVLTYAGHCGTGFDETTLSYVYNKLLPLIEEKCPFKKIPKTNEKPTWVKPHLICNIRFSEITKGQQFRIPVFLGLRIDKTRKQVNIEKPITTEKSGVKKKPKLRQKKNKLITGGNNSEITINNKNLKLTNLNKLYWAKEKITKGALIDYYLSVADIILPYLKDRPQSLHRFPNGVEQQGFYQKDIDPKEIPSWLKTVEVYSKSNKKNIHYLLCQNKASLVYMANLGCIEINPWNSKYLQPDSPDWFVIDLDPGENTFKQVVKVALMVRQLLKSINVDCYCKTSGATGIHIYIPLGAKYNYDEAKRFAEIIANLINHQLPGITSVERNPSKRKTKIYIDFLQNNRGQTLAAPYSIRPRQGATVSTPLVWDEVDKNLAPGMFTIFNTLDRIAKVGDVWKAVLGKGIDIQKALTHLSDFQKP